MTREALGGIIRTPLDWPGIVRLGLVQSALGGIVALTTSTLNRVMVVEYALPAMVPAGLVAWHYAIQLSRPRWGHGSDLGRARTPWIIGGMACLALGAFLAAVATVMMPKISAMVLAFAAFSMIGAGVGASGTSLLALLATRVVPERRPAAASLTWILMIVGIIITAGVSGALLDPFSPARLVAVAGGVAAVAFALTLFAVWGIEGTPARATTAPEPGDFGVALRAIWDDPRARRFTIFVFVSMLAYSAQDLILEPFAGLIFGFTPGESTSLAGVQHGGVLLGMVVVGALGNRFGTRNGGWMQNWTIAGCIGSALALALLIAAAHVGPGWPLRPTVFTLGFANGVFAVSAIGSMMALAGGGGAAAQGGQEGIRMGLWGAAQAIAFGMGGFLGAAGVDAGRHVFAATGSAFIAVFAVEAGLFLISAWLALRVAAPASHGHGASRLGKMGMEGSA
jgi:BCD family chlorophyll transporter-like MFS transporter